MRMYRIETIHFCPEHDHEIEIHTLIVPEYALCEYDYQSSEFIGFLSPDFELVELEEEVEDPKKKKDAEKTNVVPIKKKD